jgi:putative thiamine transport system ATP-binding protein
MADGLTLQNIEIHKGETPLLSINHHIAPGDVLTLMGPSGVGKSTLLSAIIGTLAPDFTLSGQILLNGQDITGKPIDQRRVGILFQDDLLFPHLSVGANLAFGLARGGSRRDRRTRIEQALSDIGLAGFHDRDPATLSGGQKARVALMRMLLSDPCALLLDEPFSRLDTELRGQIRDLVFQTARDQALPVLMVTHDEQDAAAADGDLITLQVFDP